MKRPRQRESPRDSRDSRDTRRQVEAKDTALPHPLAPTVCEYTVMKGKSRKNLKGTPKSAPTVSFHEPFHIPEGPPIYLPVASLTWERFVRAIQRNPVSSKWPDDWAWLQNLAYSFDPGPNSSHVEYLLEATLADLIQKANAGDVDVADSLLSSISFAVRSIEQMVKKDRRLWRELAKDMHEWPFMISNHPQRMSRNPNRKSHTEVERILDSLQLGKEHKFRVGPKTRWNYSDPFTWTALALMEYIEGASGQSKILKRLRKIIKPNEFSPHPKWFEAAAMLSILSNETAGDWWALAKQAFRKSYPTLAELPPNLVSVIKKQPSLIATDGRLYNAVLDTVKKRFFSLAKTRRLTKVVVLR